MNYQVTVASSSASVRRMEDARRASLAKTRAEQKGSKPAPATTKFAHVKSTLNTGSHVKNIKPKFDTTGEIFSRIRRSQLHQMMMRRDGGDENEQKGPVDLLSILTMEDEMKHIYDDCDFLLVDVREPEAYNKCHIIGAINFPAIKLRRDQWIPELYQYKNKDGKIIVIYDDDGYTKLGIDATSTFIQKSFVNVVLLSGGLHAMAENYPYRIFGELPMTPEDTRSVQSSRPQTQQSSASDAKSTTSRSRQGSTVQQAASLPPRSGSGTSLNASKAWK